jgi:hypothetical protein
VTTTKSTETYIAELRQALSDLPRAEVDAIIEDITPQLAESADGLGTPAELAVELRAAAGFPSGGGRQNVAARVALWTLVVATGAAGYAGFISDKLLSNDARYSMPVIGLVLVASWFLVARFGRDVTAVAKLPEVQAARGLLTGSIPPRVRAAVRLVEPGWLLTRFPLILIGMLLLSAQFGWNPVPAQVFAFAVSIVATAAGYRSLTDRRWLWLSVPAGAWAIGTALQVAGYISLFMSGHIVYVSG